MLFYLLRGDLQQGNEAKVSPAEGPPAMAVAP